MKKRLPILVVFGGVILVGLIIFLWPLIFPPNEINDRDKDGFPDEIDNCINTYSTVNNTELIVLQLFYYTLNMFSRNLI